MKKKFFLWISFLVISTFITPSPARAESGDAFGIFDIIRHPQSIDALDDLGVEWVRVQLWMGDKPKNIVTFLKKGYRLWITLYHRDASNVIEEGTVGFQRSSRGGFAPRNPQKYQALVKKTVGKYANLLRKRGLEPSEWLIVQIGNEVMPHDVRPPDKPIRFWHGSADQYLEMLDLAYDAVKIVDPHIPVALGGIASEAIEAAIHPNQPARAKPIVDWLDRQLREGRFDWVDVHLYNEIESIQDRIAFVRKRWKGPIASTELGGPDVNSGAVYSEALHTQDLKRRIQVALDAGVSQIYWVGLVENPNQKERFRKMGLVNYESGQRKPAYQAYQSLIASHR